MIKNSVINLPDKSVDLILCNFSLHHIKEIFKMIDEIKRILKPGGYLIIQEHDNTSDKQKELLDFYHYINYLLLIDIKEDDFETLYSRFQNEYYSNYTSKKDLNNMFQNYKVINEIDLKAGFVTNYLQLLKI
jgi:ubiquinone/menaquinone biosynthesis C-methylase UbiE